ncbi:hypothetical protein [Geodermatophilus sp. SYSU D00700]
MTGRTADAWTGRLRTAALSTPERLVAGQLADRLARACYGAHVDLDDLAACCALPSEVALAAVEGLAARGLVSSRADGRLVLAVPGGDAS